MFKRKNKQMEEDITKLHQKSNISEQHIATLEGLVCACLCVFSMYDNLFSQLQDHNIPLPHMPGDNVFTGRSIPSLYFVLHAFFLGELRRVPKFNPESPGNENWAGSPGGDWQGGGGGPMDWQGGHGGGGMDWQGGRGGRGMEHTDRGGMDNQFQQPPMDYGRPLPT